MSAKNASPWVANTGYEDRIDIVDIGSGGDSERQYIPLAKIPKMWRTVDDGDDLPPPPFYGPDNGPRLGLPFVGDEALKEGVSDYMLKLYIGSIGVLGVLILYHFYEKS